MSMWISRIRVTGGFLNGLDVTLSEGLNVVVGPRGAGKTTFLELLRHAVGAQHADQTPLATRTRQSFLQAVLGTGEVVVDVESDDGGRHLVVDANGGGQRPDLSKSILMLGQNELERIASDAPSRLNLLDLRTSSANTPPDRTPITTITGDIFDARTDLEERREESKKRNRLSSDRELLLSQEAALLGGGSAELSNQRNLLDQAEENVISSGQALEQIGNTRNDLRALETSQLRQLEQLQATIERAQSSTALPAVQEALSKLVTLSNDITDTIADAQARLETAATELLERNLVAREAAAPLRETLDRTEAGLGQITAQLRNVNTALRALDENENAMQVLTTRLKALTDRRNKLFERIEQSEEALYTTRAQVARTTTSRIASNVVISIDHLGDTTVLRTFLQEALRGSNTRTALIDVVADRVLPRHLLEMAEDGDARALVAVAGIPMDRAQKLLENLGEKRLLQNLSQIRLTDSVDFRLRDGSVDKSVDTLSTGQKCAVTLPIVLSEQERILILDQPEDHLDNAFLVANVVSGIVSRGQSGAQTIVATHNANIPVIGSAENVIVLNSDGKSGNVDVQGSYDSDPIVDKITGLMEGGKKAFARRSAFYLAHGGLE